MTTVTLIPPDYATIKRRQQATWAAGDYAKIGTTLQIVGETLAEALDMAPGSSVLDIAAGNGNASLAFARRWCKVTSTDYLESLLIRGQKRAEAEELAIDFQAADAEDLPFDDGVFDAVVSTFGVMFAPNQKQAANEMLRVCRRNGKIGMANWMPEGFIGQMFKTIGKHVPPPIGINSPAMWGTQDWIETAFGPKARTMTMDGKVFTFRYRSPGHFVDFFRTFYGPVHKAFMGLDRAGQEALQQGLLATVERFNTATDGSMRVPSYYAEIVITKA